MIGSLRGTFLERHAGEALVEVAGVGYRVTVNPGTSIALGEVGSEIFVHVHHHQREDDQTLYGFATVDERRCFEALLSAHGVGPSLAMAILAVHDPTRLRQVLAADDVAALCLVPGVGKKTAARLLIELKSKLDLPDIVDLTVLGHGGVGVTAAASVLADVRSALAELGYGPDEVRAAVAGLDPDGDASVLLREALGVLAEGRRSA